MDFLRKLNFSDTSEFRLIEEKILTISILVEIDKRAQDTQREAGI